MACVCKSNAPRTERCRLIDQHRVHRGRALRAAIDVHRELRRRHQGRAAAAAAHACPGMVARRQATRSTVGSSCGRAKSSRRPKRRLPNAAPDVAATVLQTAALPGPRRPAEAAPRPGQAPAGVAPCRRSTQQQRRSRASEHSPASASRRRCPSPRRRIQPPPLPTRAPDPRRSRRPLGLRLCAETIASCANPRLASCHAVAALQQQPTSKPRMAAHAGRSELRRGHACRVAAVENASPGHAEPSASCPSLPRVQ